jgi:type VI secretion system protein ImpL
MNAFAHRLGGLRRLRVVHLAWLLLGAWAFGILVAAWQLGSWRQELSRTLLHLNADALFRARVQGRDGVDPEWYRRKAITLLSATEKLQHDATWTAFMPGSWQRFDNLEEQLQARLSREFSDIVVETVRRELYARAAKLTGVPVVRATGDLDPSKDCQSPVPENTERKPTSAAAEDLVEFTAVRDYVMGIERLDAAVQSFLMLHYSAGEPEQLRELVAYTLGKELPGALEHSVRMFQGADEVNIEQALMQSRLQWAARCALGKAMSALHTRLLNTNDLFALEQGLVTRSSGLFEPSTRLVAFDRTLERYRAVQTLLDDQHALLAKGGNDWMREGTLKLGPAYQDVLERIQGTRLLGPEVVQQLRNQSGAAFTEFRRQFQQAFGSRGEPGIVWIEGERRFGLSTDRTALRNGLGALLKVSFMGEESAPPKGARDTASLAKVVEEARAIAAERARVLAEIVPTFPEQAQPVVMRVVDGRVAEIIYQRAYRTLKAGLPVDASTPLDPAAFRAQRGQVLAVQAVLKETGAGGLGERLAATLDGEVLRRLALLQEDLRQAPLYDTRLDSFAWWQGEPMQLAPALGAELAAGAPSLGRTATRSDALVERARALVALGSPALASNAATLRWQHLQAELERYRAKATDSSLLRLERYVAALGPDLRRENCAERLSTTPLPPPQDDEIGQRHIQIHQALASRCNELRAQVLPPAASLEVRTP